MSNRDKDRIDCSLCVSYSCSPGFSTITHQQTDISRFFYLFFTLFFDFFLAQSINIEEGLPDSYRGESQQNPQMACKSTLILMKNPIPIHKHQLRLELGLLFSQSLEELHEDRHLSKSQETRDVGLMANVEHFNFFVESCLHFAAVNDQSCTSNICVFFCCANVNSSHKVESAYIPLEVVLLNYHTPNLFLFLLPPGSDFRWHLGLKLLKFVWFFWFWFHQFSFINIVNRVADPVCFILAINY